MDKQEFSVAVGLVGTVGFLSALLPGIDKLWEAQPNDPIIGKNVTGATMMFSGVSLILILTATSVGYTGAAALAFIVLATALFYYHYAFRTLPLPVDVVRTVE